jgi:hypothetical protein
VIPRLGNVRVSFMLIGALAAAMVLAASGSELRSQGFAPGLGDAYRSESPKEPWKRRGERERMKRSRERGMEGSL